MLNIHKNIIERLDNFLDGNSIPNLIFHGPSGGGKRSIVNEFVSKIYGKDKDIIRAYVLLANCAHDKGIRFVREELKFFAKTNINCRGGYGFKTVVLENADSLTIDAQSALRRCIELFSHTTRFFLVVEDKNKLLRPILSRFCQIHVPVPEICGIPSNLHSYHIHKSFGENKQEIRTTIDWFNKNIDIFTTPGYQEVISIANMAYERGYSGLDVLNYIEMCDILSESERAEMLVICHRIKREFRNEKLCMFCMLSCLLIRSNNMFKNIFVV